MDATTLQLEALSKGLFFLNIIVWTLIGLTIWLYYRGNK
jgi:hypothetical protein